LGTTAEHGRPVVMVLHDLNQACRYAEHIVTMRDGRVHAAGSRARSSTRSSCRTSLVSSPG